MSEKPLTEPEYVLLKQLSQMEDVIVHGGALLNSLHERAYVSRADGGWRITEYGRRRACLPFVLPPKNS